jgi:single-strand DNA-binding protein
MEWLLLRGLERKLMRSTNLFIVRGYTGADAKPVGKAAKVSIATTRVWYDDKNAKVEKTDWVTVTILNEKAVAFALANVKKGDPVYAECRIADGSYEKDGQKIYTTDIIANTFDLLRPHDAD